MKPAELWKLNPDEFNKWRRENDLKKLFQGFREALPHFDEWLAAYNFTIDFILGTDQPGSFFYWDKETILFKSEEKDLPYYFFVQIEDKAHDKKIKEASKADGDKVQQFRFKPYFLWASEKLQSTEIIETKYSGKLDTFRYISHSAPDVPEICTAIIAPGISVLKLGGTKIEGWGQTTFRNLDFANLDFLEIEGKHRWDREHNIFYSSCRHLRFVDSKVNFTKFHACEFEALVILNSRVYWTEFYKCDLFGADIENSQLLNFKIQDCSLSSFTFNRVEVDNLLYSPPKKERHVGIVGTYQTAAENYKRFRVLFQNNGHRTEASEAFYNERLYELKYNFGRIDLKKTFQLLRKGDFYFGIPHLKDNLVRVGTLVSDYLSYIVWGFGERPSRTIICSLLLVLMYTGLYYFSGISTVGGNVVNSFYLSTIMFTTLGFGDFNPFQDGSYKILLASEALLGAFTFGLFIAGYANKSKY